MFGATSNKLATPVRQRRAHIEILRHLAQRKFAAAFTATPKPGSPLSPLITTYGYDPTYNKPTRITDPRGLVTTASYEPATGNLLSTVADAGSAPHLNATTRFSYTGPGLVLTATDPTGAVSLYGYDRYGNRTSTIRDYGTGRLNRLTTMSYSALGDVASVTDPNGRVTMNTYDAARRLTTVTTPGTAAAPNGMVRVFSYDRDGRLVRTQQSADGAVPRTTGT